MQIPLELSFHELEPSDFVRDYIRDRVDALEKYHERITSCRVAIEAPHKTEQGVKHFRVRIVTRVPGVELVAEAKPTQDEERKRDAYYTIDEAFDKMETQLRRLNDKLRADRDDRPGLLKGVIARIDAVEQSGYIEALDGREIYFENADIRNAEIDTLQEGDTVEFLPQDDQGAPQPRVEFVRA